MNEDVGARPGDQAERAALDHLGRRPRRRAADALVGSAVGPRPRGGPRVVRDTCQTVVDAATRQVELHQRRRRTGDRLVDLRGPGQAGPDGRGLRRLSRSRSTRRTRSTTPTCGPAATTRSARLDDMDLNRTERSLCFPYDHPLLRPDVPRGQGQGPGPPLRPGLQRLDDRGVVRGVRRPAAPARHRSRCGTRRRRPTRSGATRPAGCRAVTFTGDAPPPRPAVDP